MCNTPPTQKTSNRMAAFDCLAYPNHNAEAVANVIQMIGQCDRYL